MDYSHSWGYPVYDPVTTDIHGEPGKPYQFLITEVKPHSQGAEFRWQPMAGADEYHLVVIPHGSSHTFSAIEGGGELITGKTHGSVSGLIDGVDYEVRVDASAHGSYLGKSLSRWLRCGDVPGTVVSYLHPDDYSYSYSGRSPATPGILRMGNGQLIASHDVYWGDEPQTLTKLFVSEDDGKNWRFLCDIFPCFWGKLFWHHDSLYLIGCATECGDLLVGRSNDYGKTWSAPIVIYPGGTRATGGPMRSSLPVIEHRGRLWTSMDVGSYPIGYHDTVIVSVGVDSNLMQPESWVCSAPLHYNPDWSGTSRGAPITGFLEGNLVVGPDDEIYDIMRYETRGGNPSYGLAGMVRVDSVHPEKAPVFHKIINFEGNLSRFTVMRHPQSGGYYAAVSRVVEEPTYYRGRLSLMFSKDLEHWELVRDLLDIGKLNLPDWPKCTAFQYPDAFIENNVIYLVSRTAIHGAYNYHNANYVTFHKFSLDVPKEGQL